MFFRSRKRRSLPVLSVALEMGFAETPAEPLSMLLYIVSTSTVALASKAWASTAVRARGYIISPLAEDVYEGSCQNLKIWTCFNIHSVVNYNL